MILDDICGLIAGAGLGLTAGTDLFAGWMPSDPPSAVCVYEYAGAEGDYSSGGAAYLERPRFQVLVRDADYSAARVRSEAIYRLIDAIHGETIGTARYFSIRALAPPFMLPPGRDQNELSRVATNFEAMKEPSP